MSVGIIGTANVAQAFARDVLKSKMQLPEQ